MTSTNVTQTAGLFFGGAAVNAVGNMNNTVDDSFSQVMSRTSQDTGSRVQETDGQTVSAKAPVKVEKSAVRDTENVSEAETPVQEDEEAKVADVETEDEAEVDETAEEIIAEAVTQVKEAIQEELDLSDEELEAIMSELELTDVSLLQPDTVRAIAVAAAGETDEFSMLTNETLYESVQELTDIVETVVSDVKAEIGVSDEQFADIVKQMEASAEPEDIELPHITEAAAEAPVVVVEQEKAVQTPVVSKTDTTVAETEAKEPQEAAEPEEEIVPVVREEKKSSEAGRESEKGNHESGFLQGWGKTGIDAWETAPVRSEAELPRAFEMADTDRIMNQITEYMKVEAKADVTELQLQLQPETLGTLHIHLTAKEGMLTAQFAAENEAVKTVLEAQVMQLKENLNEQGIKVEAVEVTIASHEFERNFAGGEENGSRYEEPKKRGVRRIQLSDDIPLDEMDLSEDERIAAEMMEQSGNTVDYTA